MKMFLTLALILWLHASCERNSDQQWLNEPDCQRWEQLFSTLAPDSKRALQEQNVVRVNTQWLISREIVGDCRLNLELGSYFAKRVDRPDSYRESERQFAVTHSKEIVTALRKLWPTLDAEKSSMRDGAFAEEKYELFTDPGLEQKDLAAFISELIDRGSVSREFAGVLINRPMIEVRPALFRDLAKAETRKDIPEQIYCLAVLQNMHDPSVVPKLKNLAKEQNLNTKEHRVVGGLLIKAHNRERIQFSDIEDLEN